MTEQDETKFDDVVRSFSAIATLEVPRDLDPATISAGGRRRMARRKWTRATLGATLAAAAVAVVATTSGVLGTQAPVAGGPSPAPSPALTPLPSTPPSTPQPSVRPSNNPAMPTPQNAGWVPAWEAKLVALKVPISRNYGSGSTENSIEASTSVVKGKSAGYVALFGTVATKEVSAAQRATRCPIKLYPVDGTGMQCKRSTDAQGPYWVKTYTDSYQSRTVIVQVADDNGLLTLAQSQGFPTHRVFWDEKTKYVLPWDGRDPLNPEGGGFRAAPKLDALPLTLAQQLELTRTLVKQPR